MSGNPLAFNEIGARVIHLESPPLTPSTFNITPNTAASGTASPPPQPTPAPSSKHSSPLPTPFTQPNPTIWLALTQVGLLSSAQLRGLVHPFILPTQLRGLVQTGDWVACTLDAAQKKVLSLRCLHRPQHWQGSADAQRWNRFEEDAQGAPPNTPSTKPAHATTPSPQPSTYQPSRMNWLYLRSRLVRRLRDIMHQGGFLEVETPSLTQAPSPEAVFHPIAAEESWLITSPEHHLKRLLCGGFGRVYRLGPVWRGGDLGRWHNPEFTLLEWCESFADEATLKMRLKHLGASCAPLAKQAAQLWQGVSNTLVPKHHLAHQHIQAKVARLDACANALSQQNTWLVLSVAQAFKRYLGFSPDWEAGAKALYQQASTANIPHLNHLDPTDFTSVFGSLLDHLTQHLPKGCVLLEHWPAQAASLAQLHPQNPSLALRIEWYVNGIELANGFCELIDAKQQRQRYLAEHARRQGQGQPSLPMDEAFLDALEQGMPPAAGMAIGIERLLLALCGANHIAQTLPFAWHER